MVSFLPMLVMSRFATWSLTLRTSVQQHDTTMSESRADVRKITPYKTGQVGFHHLFILRLFRVLYIRGQIIAGSLDWE